MWKGRNMSLAVQSLVRTAGVSEIAFVFLNVADAWLTQQLLARGGVEAFWWSSSFNANMFIKALLAFLVAVVLMRLGRPRFLTLLNIGMGVVVGSNLLCYLAHSITLLYWQAQIATFCYP